MEGNITIKTIANHLGLSVTTVSRVLNGTSDKYRISKKTQEIVLKRAKELNYIPNMAAKTLRLNQSKTVGLLLPSLNNPFFSLVASTVSQILCNQGYVVLMSDCNGDPNEERKMLETLLSQNLLGILIIPTGNKNNFKFLKSIQIPTIFIDRFFDDLNFYHVSTDHYKSVIKLMNYLIKEGHRKIACIQGDLNVKSNEQRVQAYKDSVKKNELTYEYIAGDSFTAEDGYLETKLLLKTELPSAILALSDTILLGVLRALKEEGINVPNDISLVSIDNSTYLDFLEVPITSVSQPVSQIAQLATKLLLDLLKNPDNLDDTSKDRSILLDSIVIYRSSVKNLT
jgi:LacI family transcriptional regulator